MQSVESRHLLLFLPRYLLEALRPGQAIAPSLTRTYKVLTQPLAGMTDPADAPGRHASYQRERRNVLRHHGAGGDEAVFTKPAAAYDGRVGSDRGAPLHQ